MRSSFLFSLLLLSFTSCFNKVDPEVSTKYIREGSREDQRSVAVTELYNHFNSGNKDKRFYEVVSKGDGRFILNFNTFLPAC